MEQRCTYILQNYLKTRDITNNYTITSNNNCWTIYYNNNILFIIYNTNHFTFFNIFNSIPKKQYNHNNYLIYFNNKNNKIFFDNKNNIKKFIYNNIVWKYYNNLFKIYKTKMIKFNFDIYFLYYYYNIKIYILCKIYFIYSNNDKKHSNYFKNMYIII